MQGEEKRREKRLIAGVPAVPDQAAPAPAPQAAPEPEPAAPTQTGTEVQTQIDAQQLRQSVLSPRKPHQTSKFRGSDRDGLVD